MLTHISWSYHQHHHKSVLHQTHFSFLVTHFLWESPVVSLVNTDLHSCPQQQQDFVSDTEPWSRNARSAGFNQTNRWVQMLMQITCVLQVLPRTRAVPDWEKDALFCIYSRALSQQVSDTRCKCTGFHFALSRLDAQIYLCSQLIEGLSHGKHKILNEFYR